MEISGGGGAQMPVAIRGTSIDELFNSALETIQLYSTIEDTRGGLVHVMPHPMLTIWRNPTKRVLLNETRNCNHAFHLNEALWMLKGERDARKLDPFISDFSERYAEPDGMMHGAYGYRWRNTFDRDQITEVIDILTLEPRSRRAVIQMWEVDQDLHNDTARDVPCNTHIYFRLYQGTLDMTVCNRSNDIIWGLYGANAVHFSILMEFIASAIDAKMGTMYTLSNNFHAYQKVLAKQRREIILCKYRSTPIAPDFEDFGKDLRRWNYNVLREEEPPYKTKWFNQVAFPVTAAFFESKKGNYDKAKEFINTIIDDGWRTGMMNRWLREEHLRNETLGRLNTTVS
jgi:thymidylate synthase